MAFTPQRAAQRFGYGLSPRVDAPRSVADMLAALRGPDDIAARYPMPAFSTLQAQIKRYNRFGRFARDNQGTEAGEAAAERQREVQQESWRAYLRIYARTQMRRIETPDAFRERLVAFWADHFTAHGKQGLIKLGAPYYVEEAIRPHVTGRFADLLLSAVRHPVMLHYLDQDTSVGPNSVHALKHGRGQGLNENLAREVLELHTLGVDGPYTQEDVRALAALLTGLGRQQDFSPFFRVNIAEPGHHTVLGTTYGATLSPDRIEAGLRDLAAHPATAAHLARKLAVHFVADDPPAALVDAMTAAYRATGGDLMAVYAALLEHPAAWEGPARNIRPAGEFVSACLRALAVPPAAFDRLPPGQVNGLFLGPLRLMGQEWLTPAGPDGAEEADAAWTTPQGLAGRLEWAMTVPRHLLRDLPDPRQVVFDALGKDAPQKVVFAAQSAESRAEAIGLILISPAFQRR